MYKILIVLIVVLTPFISNAQNDVFFENVRKGDLDAVKELLAKDESLIAAKTSMGFTPLILAAYYNQGHICTYLLENGANANEEDRSGNTALMGIAFKGYTEVAEILIKHGAIVNQRNFNDATALTFASTFGHGALVKLLLKNGADLTLKDNRGNTPMSHAEIQGNEEIIQIIKDYLASTD